MTAIICITSVAFAGSNQNLVYQGRISRTDGTAVNSGTIVFSLAIYSPAPARCLLYSETQSVDMNGSAGMFSLKLGAGSRTDAGAHAFTKVFINGSTLSGLSCASGSAYTSAATDDRELAVSFNDAGTVVNLSSMQIKSVPFALQAHEIDGWGLNNLVKVSSVGSPTTFTTGEMANVKLLAAPGPCVAGEVLKWSGSAWACASDATGGAPADASYAAKGIVQFLTDAATSGITVSSGVASVNSGTGANQIVKLDGTAKLPAVDGSALTSLTPANLSAAVPINKGGTGQITAILGFNALSPITAKGDLITSNGTNNVALPLGSNGYVLTADSAQATGLKWAPIPASGTVTSVSSANADISVATGTTTPVLTLNSGTGANQIVKLDGSAKLPAVDGSALTNISATAYSGVLPIANGGTNSSTALSNNRVMLSSGGKIVEAGAMTNGQIIIGSTSAAPAIATLGSSNGIDITTGAGTLSIATNATDANTASKIVSRDASGNFAAGAITNNSNILKGATSGTLTMTVPTTVTSYTLTWPSAVGGAGSFLTTDASGNLSWGSQAAISDSSYSAKGAVQFLTDAATSGITVSSGVANVNTGTGANQIVKLDGSAKLPGVDGSALTNLNPANLSAAVPINKGGTGQITAILGFNALSPITTKGDLITFNGTNNIRLPAGTNGYVLTADSTQAEGLKWAAASNGTVTSVSSANSDISVATGTTTPVLTLNSGTGANQIVKLTAAGKYPAVDGSLITNIDAGNISAGTLPVTRGGTGNTTYGNSGVIVSNVTGTALQSLNCTNGQVISFDVSGYAVCGSAAGATGFVNGGNSFGANASLGTNDNYNLTLKTNNVARMTLLSSGSIGVGTTSPGGLFTVEKGSNNSTELQISTPGVSGNQDAYLSIVTKSSSSWLGQAANKGWIVGARGDAFSTAAQQNDFFVSYWSGSGYTYALSADSATGNVGIGTVTPGALLDIGTAGSKLGTMRLEGNTSGYVQIQPAAAAGSWTMTLPADAGTNGYVLSTNGAGVTSWVAQNASGTGTVTSVSSANTDIGVATGTTTPVLTLNTGTGANQIVKLDGSSRLPAVDGSALTNLSPGNLSAAVPISKGGTGQTTKVDGFNSLSPITAKGDLITFDGTNNVSLPLGSNGYVLTADSAQATGLKWAAASGGTVISVSSANSDIGVAMATTTPVLTLNTGTGNNQIVKLTAAGKYPAVDGSLITSLNAGNISSGTLPVTRGGTGNTTYGNNGVIVSNGTGSAFQTLNCTSGQVITFDVSGYAICGAAAGATGFVNGGNSFAGAATLGTNDNFSLSFETNNTSRMTIDNSGKVGIGTGAPLVPLQVGASVVGLAVPNGVGTNTNPQLIVSTTSGTSALSVGVNDGTNNRRVGLFMDDTNGVGGISTEQASTAFPFVFRDAIAERLRIESGKVGIANSAPGALLDIGTIGKLGTMRLGGSTSGYVQIQPAAAAGSWTMTLPADAGTNGYVLSTNGSGVTSWVAQGGGASAFVNGGNSFAVDATLGSNDNFGLNFETNNTNRMSITSGGFVGIGTTAPNSRFHIGGGTGFSTSTTKPGGSSVIYMTMASPVSGASVSQIIGVNDGSRNTRAEFFVADDPTEGSGAWGLWSKYSSAGAQPFVIGVNDSEKFRIDKSGNVGISTTAPAGILDVQGGTAGAGSNGKSIILTAQNAGSGNRDGGNIILTPGAKSGTGANGSVLIGYTSTPTWMASNSLYVLNNIYAGSVIMNSGSEIGFGDDSTRIYGTTPAGYLGFFTSNAEQMRIDSAGKVGIGNIAPGALLDVGKAGTTLGTMRLEGNTSGYVQLQPAAAAGSWTMTLPANAGTNGYVLSTNGSGVTSWVAQTSAGSAFINGGNSFAGAATIGTNDSNSLNFETNNSTHLSILANGNVGVGNTSPNSKFEVYKSFGTLPAGISKLTDFTATGSGAASNDSSLRPLAITGTATGSKTFSDVLGIESLMQNSLTAGTVGVQVGVSNNVRLNGAGNTGAGYGYRSYVELATGSTGSITGTLRHFEARTPNVSGSGTIANAVGLYVENQKVTGVTEAYGVYQNGSNDLNYFAGKVGIGVTDPQAKLHVVGDGNSIFMEPANGTNAVAVYMLNSGNSAEFGIESSGGGWLMNGTSPYATVFGTQNARSFQIGTNNSVRMTVDSTGNVGIGTTGPNEKLEVNGNVRIGSQATRATASNRGQLSLGSTYTKTANANTTLDWSNGNIQELNTFACDGTKTITMSNLKDGAAYTLLLTGTAAHSGTCVFSSAGFNFKTSGGAAAPTASKDVLFTFVVINNIVVYSMTDNLQ